MNKKYIYILVGIAILVAAYYLATNVPPNVTVLETDPNGAKKMLKVSVEGKEYTIFLGHTGTLPISNKKFEVRYYKKDVSIVMDLYKNGQFIKNIATV